MMGAAGELEVVHGSRPAAAESLVMVKLKTTALLAATPVYPQKGTLVAVTLGDCPSHRRGDVARAWHGLGWSLLSFSTARRAVSWLLTLSGLRPLNRLPVEAGGRLMLAATRTGRLGELLLLEAGDKRSQSQLADSGEVAAVGSCP